MSPRKRTTRSAPESGQVTVDTAIRQPVAAAPWLTVERLHAAIDASVQNGDTRDLFVIYRDFVLADSHVQAEFTKRKLALMGDKLSVIPGRKNSALAADAASSVSSIIRNCTGWTRGLSHLLDAALLPASVCECVFALQKGRYGLVAQVPVPHHLLDWSSGSLCIRDQTPDGSVLGTSHPAAAPRYIVHQSYLLSGSPCLGGPMRALLFWTLFASMSRDWWIRFLDRFGSPFIVAKHDEGDESARALLTRALSQAQRLFGLVVSRNVEVTLHDASKSGADAYKTMIDTAHAEQSKLILGQTLSATPSPTGLGSSVADLQSAVRDDVREWDAQALSSTLHAGIVVPLCDWWNIPEEDRPVLSWGAASARTSRERIAALKELRSAGLTVSDASLSDLSEQIGLQIVRDPLPVTPAPSWSP
jgi:phage gp29-like protein